MSASSSQALITDAITDYGAAMLVVLGAVIVVGVGFLVFRIGWSKVKRSHK